jgi:hypothetical protein
MIGVNRRRVMGGGAADEIIMTSVSNIEVLAVCYAQGWCADANYMTKREAEAVTDIGTAFQSNTSITHFEELQYFSALTSLVANAFNGCTALSSLVLPTSVTSLGSNCFVNCPFEELDLSSITFVGGFCFNTVGLTYPWLPSITRSGTASGGSAAFYNCRKLVGIRLDSITYLGSLVNGSSARYLIVTTTSVPSGTNPSRWPNTIYVRDELIASYQAAENWSTKTIKGISKLPTDDPDCPWISDLIEKGLII